MDSTRPSRSLALSQLLLACLVLLAGALFVTPPLVQAATIYYVDCSATTNGSGTQTSPWNNLTTINNRTFAAGDTIRLRRATTCNGALWPKGSGASGAPITLEAYGTGALPIISAGTNQYAIRLWNQQYWRIQNIETTGGTRYGIWVSGNTVGALNHFRLTNVVVHDVTGGTLDNKATGLIVFTPGVEGNKFNDVVIDGATVYNTTLWAGIVVGAGTGADAWATDQTKRSTNITIRNSTAHHTYGDGIILFIVNNGLIENSVVYETGNQPTQTIGTPNGLWTWACKDCVVQNNEVYLSDSPGVDGGAFDIDYFNDNNTVQYNYGHDNSKYCIAVFGAENYTTTNSVIRYNICANNGQQDIVFWTWNGGSIDGVQIYNNTFYTTLGAIYSEPASLTFTGTRPRFFKNNVVYSTNANPLGASPAGLTRDYNLYYSTAGAYSSGEPNSIHKNPLLNSPTYHGVGRPTTQFTLQAGSPATNAGTNVCAGITGCSTGTRDFYGNAIPQGGVFDIGAHESRNLLRNPGFESGAASPWQIWPTTAVAVVGSNARTGTSSMRVTGSSAGFFLQLTNLSPSTTYTFRGWLKADATGNQAYLYAKNTGGTAAQSANASSTTYTQLSIQFTTGASSTSAEIGVWRDPNFGTGFIYGDDFELLKS